MYSNNNSDADNIISPPLKELMHHFEEKRDAIPSENIKTFPYCTVKESRDVQLHKKNNEKNSVSGIGRAICYRNMT